MGTGAHTEMWTQLKRAALNQFQSTKAMSGLWFHAQFDFYAFIQ